MSENETKPEGGGNGAPAPALPVERDPARYWWVLMLVAVLVGGAVAYQVPNWRWGTIAMALDFAAVVLLLMRDEIKAYGFSFRGQKNAQKLAEKKSRGLARWIHTYVFGLAVALILLGVAFQFMGNPPDPRNVQIVKLPAGTVFPLGNGLELDLQKLDVSLKALETNQKTFSASLSALTYPELILVHCEKKAGQCACPKHFERVSDNGKWNLNEGTEGDLITLCRNDRPIAAAASAAGTTTASAQSH